MQSRPHSAFKRRPPGADTPHVQLHDLHDDAPDQLPDRLHDQLHDQGGSTPPDPDASGSPLDAKELGRQLRQVRRQQGLSRGDVARSAGLTRRELAAYERGRVEISESDLWCLAGSCGVEVSELLPPRDELHVDPSLASLTIGDTTRQVPPPAEPDVLLREYLAMIYELRQVTPGSPVPLREPDLATLADALGGTPESIEARLVELVGTSHDEAVRLRAMILGDDPTPPRAPVAGSSLGADEAGDAERYARAIQHEPAPAIDEFFATPAFERAAAHHAVERITEPFGLPATPATPRTRVTEEGLSPIVPARDLWGPSADTVPDLDPITPIAWRAP